MVARLRPGDRRPTRLGVVLKGYPRLSETFIAQEIESLERLGADVTIVSLRYPTNGKIHPVHDRIAAGLLYLPEYLFREPLRVFRGWWRARRLPGYSRALIAWLRDLGRDPTPNRARRWGQALVLSAELDPAIQHLYAHFLHTPASVARYTALITERTWSVSAHAKDIWLTPEWEKREKLADCDWAVTCTGYGHAHLASLGPGKVSLSYHGLDLSVLPRPPARLLFRRGDKAAEPVRLLSVGRAVPKKGLDVMIDALAALPSDLQWRWTHIGGGADLNRLKRRSEALGLAGRIVWLGARAQAEVFEAYRSADLFVLPSRIADDGDRDGLPNVLMEAASQGLCCIASDVAAVSELLRDGETGVLVPPDDPCAVGSAIARLAQDPDHRHALGRSAFARVSEDFDHRAAVAVIATKLGLDLGCMAGARVLETDAAE